MGRLKGGKNLIPSKFCRRGHDRAIVGRYTDGHCKACRKIEQKKNRKTRLMRARKYKQMHVKEMQEYQRKWAKKNKIRVKESQLRNCYGITLEEHDRMLTQQKERCLGCNKHQSDLKKILGVDHDHKTGKVRGLLCDDCNQVIGRAKDDVKILKRLIKYLNKNK
jgi:hypothetical protein